MVKDLQRLQATLDISSHSRMYLSNTIKGEKLSFYATINKGGLHI